MTAHETQEHRQILVRCQVKNRNKDTSIRFVEKTQFQLWQYMVTNKHNFSIDDASICLWMTAAEYTEQADVFSQVGLTEPVELISFAIYDQQTGLCDTLQRFIPKNDSQAVQKVLLKRIPTELRRSDDFILRTAEGIAVVQKAQLDINQLGQVMHF